MARPWPLQAPWREAKRAVSDIVAVHREPTGNRERGSRARTMNDGYKAGCRWQEQMEGRVTVLEVGVSGMGI